MTPIREVEEQGAALAVVGRIRLGVFTGKAPKASTSFVLTAPSPTTLEPLARDFGGRVEPYTPQGQSEDAFRVVTESAELVGMFPAPHVEDVFDQWYELWTAIGRARKCDGELCDFVDETTGEVGTGAPCLCTDDPYAKATERECSPRTRLRLWLPQTVGLGVWEVSTSSVWAAFGLASQLAILEQVLGGDLRSAPVVLRYLPRAIRYRDASGKAHRTTKRIVTIDLALHVAELRRLDRDPLAVAEAVLGRYGGRALPDPSRPPEPNPPDKGTATPGAAPAEQPSLPGSTDRVTTGSDAGGAGTPESAVESSADPGRTSQDSGAPPVLPEDDPTRHAFVGSDEFSPCAECGFAIEAHRRPR
jgi:hypothetical protein